MKQWYGVRTFPGYEAKVRDGINKLIKKNDLQEQIVDIFIPTNKNYTFVRREIRKKEELIFPGYVFIKMKLTNELMYSVRGVQYIVGYAGTNELKKKPDPITEEEIKKMMETSEQLSTDLKIGQEVMISDFSGEFPVTIKKIELEREKIIAEDGKEYSFDIVRKVK